MDTRMFVPNKLDRDLYSEFEDIVRKNISSKDNIPCRVYSAVLPKFELENVGVSYASEKFVDGKLYTLGGLSQTTYDGIVKSMNYCKPCIPIELPITLENPSISKGPNGLKDILLSTGQMGIVRVESKEYVKTKEEFMELITDNGMTAKPLPIRAMRDNGEHLHIIQKPNFYDTRIGR
jgi:hypothetical protein